MNEERLNELQSALDAPPRQDNDAGIIVFVDDLQRLINTARRCNELEAERDGLSKALANCVQERSELEKAGQFIGEAITALKAENERLRELLSKAVDECRFGFHTHREMLEALSTPAPQADINKGQDG